ncbi:MAG TPA: alkaline phosphatase family protein, partial [Pedococcus sp.]|nr:alkaline phosphatase family protein [Pedococcus sp.]
MTHPLPTRTPARARTRTAVVVAALVALVAGVASSTVGATAAGAATTAGSTSSYLPPAKHVFVINLENKGYDETWGPGSAAPYLSQTLRAKGNLLSQYYGTAHNSLPNYVAQVTGQGPNSQTQADCQVYSDFVGAGTVPPGQAVGDGCVYPASVPSLPQQLDRAGLTWRGYMEDMGTPCRHPALNTADDTQKARVGDQYAARHNPFVYLHSVVDDPAYCASHDVDLGQLSADLASTSTTRNLTYITPNLCHDGHDSPCVNGEPGGLASADEWLRQTVPAILGS